MGARLREFVPYVAVLLLTAAMLAGLAPGDEAALPDVGARARVDLAAVEGLAIDDAPGLPPFRARRAAPRAPAGPVALAGVARALALVEVRVELGPDLWLEAERGELTADALSLERARVPAPVGGGRLVAGRVEFADDRVRFPDLVVWFPGTARERIERGVELDRSALVARLQAR